MRNPDTGVRTSAPRCGILTPVVRESGDGDDLSASFPELTEASTFAACLDGEMVAAKDGRVMNIEDLRRRLSGKVPSAKLLRDVPVYFLARDILAIDGEGLLELAFDDRYGRLGAVLAQAGAPRLLRVPELPFTDWEDLAAQRSRPARIGDFAASTAHGCLLARRWPDGPGREPAAGWVAWKPEPMAIDCVLMYAQTAQRGRTGGYSSYTFGLRGDDGAAFALVPIGKLAPPDDAMVRQAIDQYISHNIGERFGPVREVTARPEAGLVCKIAFDGLNRSKRRKSGLELINPRIVGPRSDLTPADTAPLQDLKKNLPN